jgi:hypothetical protein
VDATRDLPEERRAELMRALAAQLDGELRWLRDRHDLQAAEAAWPALWLASPRASVRLTFDPALHGAKLALGADFAEPESLERLTLETAARHLDAATHDVRSRIVDGPGDVPAAAAALSSDLSAVEPLVAGEPEAFRTVRRRYKEAVTRISLEYALEDASQDAGEAWRARDLERVVAILEPLEGHLPRHQQGWLDYARRKRA